MAYRLLWVDDETELLKAHILFLEKKGYEVETATNGYDALERCGTETFDLILLDENMPGMSGLEVLSLMRRNRITTPVLLLTAKAEVEDRVAGLEAGADDYLPKPFATSELIARIKALGRRSENYSDSVQTAGNVVLDGNRYEMRAGNKSVKLTNKEFQLMELFVLHPGFVFSTDHLMEKIWGYETDSDIDVVWTTIGYVRKKLRGIGASVEIKTIRGAGYSLEVTE